MVEWAVLHRERAASQNAEVPSGIVIYSHKNDLMSSLEMLQNWTKYLSAHSLRFSLLISHTCIRALEAASVDSVKNVWTLHTATQTLFCCLCHSYRDRKLLLDFKQAFPRYLHTTFPTLSPCWPFSLFFPLSPLFFSIALVFSPFPCLLKTPLNTKGRHFDKRDKGGELFSLLLCSPSLLDVLNNNMLHLLFSHLSPSWYLNFCHSILGIFFLLSPHSSNCFSPPVSHPHCHSSFLTYHLF